MYVCTHTKFHCVYTVVTHHNTTLSFLTVVHNNCAYNNASRNRFLSDSTSYLSHLIDVI